MANRLLALSRAGALAAALGAPAGALAQPPGYYYSHHHHYRYCVRRHANEGTATGAVVGAATVGLLSHSLVGAVVGGGVGALAGHQIARNQARYRC